MYVYGQQSPNSPGFRKRHSPYCQCRHFVYVSKKRFLLRLDPELYAVLEKWAADDLRIDAAQIEFLLKQAVRQAKRTKQQADKAEQIPEE